MRTFRILEILSALSIFKALNVQEVDECSQPKGDDCKSSHRQRFDIFPSFRSKLLWSGGGLTRAR
jgi:hypothetical protein